MSGRLVMVGQASTRGDSAVMKSYLPGKGYVPAMQAGKVQLRQAIGHRPNKPIVRPKSSSHPEQAGLTALRKIPTASSGRKNLSFGPSVSPAQAKQVLSSTPKKIRRPVVYHGGTDLPPGASGMTFARAGSRKPAHVLMQGSAPGSIARHEFEHSQPKRSYHRLKTIQDDARKIGREEGRADARMVRARGRNEKVSSDYEAESILNQRAKAGNKVAGKAMFAIQANPKRIEGYDQIRRKLGVPNRGLESLPDSPVMSHVRAGEPSARRFDRIRSRFGKVDTTMSERQAARIARQYGTKGPLPKGLDRDTKMKAYEGRYIASGGKKGEMWGRRADRAEVGRNIGLASATVAAGGLLAARGRRTGPAMARNKVLRHATPHRLETAALGSALGGGWSELYGEHARSRRASYQNTPAGVAGSALTRMRAYTPDRRTT